MLMLIAGGYCVLVWLLFFKLKLIPWNPKTKAASIFVGVALMVGILVLLAQGSPQATSGFQITTRTVGLQAYSGGRVTKIHVNSFQRLKKGDPIVEVDKTPYENSVRMLEAQVEGALQSVKQMAADLEAAKAQVELAKANINAAKSGIDAAKANSESAVAALASSRNALEAAKADTEANKSNVRTGDIQLERIRGLVKEDVASQAELDNAENALVAAKAGLAAARANQDRAEQGVLGAEAAVRAAQAYEQQTRLSLKSLSAQLDAANAAERKAQIQVDSTIDGEHTSVRQLRDQLATARFNLGETLIRAPDDGFVAALNITVGDMLSAGQFGTFVLEGQYWAGAVFSQASIRHVKPGQLAEIALASRPGEVFEAEVDAVVWASGEAQMAQSGQLVMIDQFKPPMGVGVRFKLKAIEGFDPEMGASGTVAIYTAHGQAFAIIRKIMLRIQSLLYYLG
ncbi:MAG: biotin/lipoyl-binding protein [Planctomycetota bacterium]|nr:biotin/lipoyl-binding protein [Planctomycetota bacterium]